VSRIYFTDRDLGKQFPNQPPYIAKVYRASPADLARNPTAKGTISLRYLA
jgi:hypothetical protein